MKQEVTTHARVFVWRGTGSLPWQIYL